MSGVGGRENRESLFSGYRISVLQGENEWGGEERNISAALYKTKGTKGIK